MIEAGRRRLIDQDAHRVRALSRRAAGEDLYPGKALASLAAVEALEKKTGEARERPPIAPVPSRSCWRPCPTSRPRSPPWSGSSS
jgi:hypothetical protein